MSSEGKTFESKNANNIKLVCSGFAAVSGVVVGYPLDTLKTRLQVLGSKIPASKVSLGSSSTSYPSLYSNTMDCLSKTVKHEGVKGLFRGVTVTLIGQAPIFGLAFFGIDSGKIVAKMLTQPADNGFHLPSWAIATCLSGGVTTLLMTPAERLKCLLQIQASGTNHRHYKGAWDCAKNIWQMGGIRSMYRGIGVTYLRGVSQAGVYLGTCDKINTIMTPSNGKMSPNRAMVTGGLTGMLVWAAILPIDIVKTIVQTAPEGNRKSAVQIVLHLARTEGVKAFYRGFTPVVMRAMITNIGMFGGFRLMHTLLTEPLIVSPAPALEDA